MIRWFKTRRALITMLDERGDIIAKQIDEIAVLRGDADATAEATESRIGFMQRAANGLRRSVQAEHRLRTDAEDKLARVVDELHKLRDDINAAWTSNPPTSLGVHPPNLPAATGVGMARPPAPRYDGMAARLRAQPLPADLVDAIDEETTAKRLADGEGDQ